MATVSASDVKRLREATGGGMMDCKRALEESGGDFDKAVEALRVKGKASAAKRGEREAAEGVVASYIHANGKIGVLVEVNCETDFVARNEDFVNFARDIALHVAAADPQYVSADDVPEDAKQAEMHIFAQQAAEKPEEIRQKIAEGRIDKWLSEVVLLMQPHVNQDKFNGQTIEQIRTETAAKTGENIIIRRFSRFSVGQ